MKKVLLLILTFTYLTTSSGASIYLHQCMGKFSSVDFGKPEKESDKCGKCGMGKNKTADCCQDYIIVLKAAQDQQQPQSLIYNIKLFPVFIPVVFSENQVAYFSRGFKSTFNYNNSHHHKQSDFQAFYCCILI